MKDMGGWIVVSAKDNSPFEALSIDSNEMLKLDHQLCFSIYACYSAIMKLYRPVLAELNLTYTQYITMLVLWEQDGLSVKELGNRLHLDSGTLTPLLKKLETGGLLTRTRDKADERSVIISLTTSGHALKAKAACIPAGLYADTTVDLQEIVSLKQQIDQFLHKLS